MSGRGDLSLDLLPLDGPAPAATAQALFRQWLTLCDYSSLRDAFPTAELALIDVLGAPSAAEAIERFAKLSGASTANLNALRDGLTVPMFNTVSGKWSNQAPDLSRLEGWQRIFAALVLISRTGSSPQQLFDWARAREIKQLSTGPEILWYTWTARDKDNNDRGPQNQRLSQASKDVVRARYGEEQWRTIAKPLNDLLRERRKSALIGFVLALPEIMQARVTDSNRMFEYFLIDVEMDPCMQTSRIRQGIASVQIFIQRVLLNLESPEVPPSHADRHRWEWMKNYRVWEANRKVFPYPESYTEEELRDDKTPFFQEFESELLQDELNEVNVERALRHYLEKLDAVSKLTVCGLCIDKERFVMHIFARTSTSPFVYYYRRLEASNAVSWEYGVWTPWEKLPVDITTIEDGDNSGIQLLPIVWNRRLYLFWPLFEQRPDEDQNRKLPQGFNQINEWHIKLAWSEYKDGQWSPKEIGTPVVVSGSHVEESGGYRYEPHEYRTDKHCYRVITSVKPGLWDAGLAVAGYGLAGAVGAAGGALLGENTNPPVLKDSGVKCDPIPTAIKDDPLLNGVVLEGNDDFANHTFIYKDRGVYTLLAKPADHFLDATSDNDHVIIRIFSRYRGIPTGQRHIEIEDVVNVIKGNQRTDHHDKKELTVNESRPPTKIFAQIGRFEFPNCRADPAAYNEYSGTDYNTLSQPQGTVNSYMAFRGDSTGVKGLQLNPKFPPVLGFVPNNFEVIDADNRNGFDRTVPFFYQDQQRCYLVTRQLLRDPGYFGSELVHPDEGVSFAQRVKVLIAVADRQTNSGAEAGMSIHPWTQSALAHWAAGPSVPKAFRRNGSASMQTLSLQSAAERFRPSDYLAERNRSGSRITDFYTFTPHYHPYICDFIAALNSGGLPKLFALDNQKLTDWLSLGEFFNTYKPDPSQVRTPYPLEIVDFSRIGAYSKYNWELFFHAPLLIATRYSRAGFFEDAHRWFQIALLDPFTDDKSTDPGRYWRFLPFRITEVQRIDEMIGSLTYNGNNAVEIKKKDEILSSIQEWLDHPFQPHLIARRRPGVYMKHVFMKCLDNLIAWGDSLYMRNTREDIDEATQLYILAANLLGPRPQVVPAPGPVAPETYQSLRERLDVLSNAQVDLETRLPFTQIIAPNNGVTGQLAKLPQTLYFCLPQNDRLLSYWDTVADRLFKIRHCMNIEGVVQQLPLFEPPIDPMLLVQAVAQGVDIGSVLNDLYAPLPHYRFSFMLQKASEICAEIRSFGNLLQGVLEKRDSEKLALLRAEQETLLLDLIKNVKKRQIDEAEETLQSLNNSARIVQAAIDYYENLLLQGLIPEETDQLGNLDQSNSRQEDASWIEAGAQSLNLIPNFTAPLGPGVPSTSFGGSNLGAAVTAVARSYTYLSASYAYKANRASITGGHNRREQDWRYLKERAKRESDQIQRQITAQSIRKAIAEAELHNHETQIKHARAIEDLLRNKFSNEALYSWQEGKLTTIYRQCYEIAYKFAKAAERCWCYERGIDTSFIKFGNWDSAKRGLLAGEQLYLQLKQMERAYLEQQIREYEITKQVSLLQLDPIQLIALKETGTCEIDVPEWLFDLDFPGHYFRRLKTVSITIPCVVGPYTNLSATLTLLSSKVRKSARIVGGSKYDDDENYRSDHRPVEAIATSSAQNDSGVFELNFRDERYLPFEGAGAISCWSLKLPDKYRQIDYNTISDVVLHLKYTARGDGMLAEPARNALTYQLSAIADDKGGQYRLFSLRHEFPSEWRKMRIDKDREATFPISKDRFPLFVQGGSLTVKELHYALILKEPHPTLAFKATLTPSGGAVLNMNLQGQKGKHYLSGSQEVTIAIPAQPKVADWEIKLLNPTTPDEIDNILDILVTVRYTYKPET